MEWEILENYIYIYMDPGNPGKSENESRENVHSSGAVTCHRLYRQLKESQEQLI